MAKLYGIGVGPGDSELLTIKAVRAIENCDIIVAPVAVEGGESVAYEIAKEYINSKNNFSKKGDESVEKSKR